MTTQHTEQSELEELIERLNASADWLEYGAKPSGVLLPSGPDLRKAAALLAEDKKQPLTDEQVRDCWDSVRHMTGESRKIHAFASAIEQAHGIGKDQP